MIRIADLKKKSPEVTPEGFHGIIFDLKQRWFGQRPLPSLCSKIKKLDLRAEDSSEVEKGKYQIIFSIVSIS